MNRGVDRWAGDQAPGATFSVEMGSGRFAALVDNGTELLQFLLSRNANG